MLPSPPVAPIMDPASLRIVGNWIFSTAPRAQFSPILDAGDKLGYMHIGESHRGYLGSGTVDFDALFRGRARVGYDGPVVFESFSSAVVNADLSNTLAIWRNLWEDSGDLAAHANRYALIASHFGWRRPSRPSC